MDSNFDAIPDLLPETTAPAVHGATPFLSTLPASPRDRRLAFAVIALSTLCFLAAVPFARVPLARIPAFIPAYESALAVNDLISAVLLFGLFMQLRRCSLLALASGYLFDALMIVPHALTFPGVFSGTGLLGAGTQTTAWVYLFWHGGFALFLLAYGLLGRFGTLDARLVARPGRALACAIAGAAALAALLTLAATVGQDLLPVVVQSGNFTIMITKGISPTLLAMIIAPLIVLAGKKPLAVLDIWILVVLFAWVFDVALSAVVSAARFDLAWYAGRAYGLLAASFVLVTLLVETSGLHRSLAAANDALADSARNLGERVHERTRALEQANAALRHEIAERRQTEAHLVQAQKMEAIGNLTGGMAHDFNNMLGVVIGNLDLLCGSGKADPETTELAREALDASLRGAELTRRLLAFARRQSLQPEHIDVNQHVGGIGKLLARTLGEQIEIKFDFAADAWPVIADPAQLEASLANLANNARDAMPKGGRLSIRTANRTLDADYASLHADLSPGDFVMIEVSDTGEGMPPERLNRIFEPFFTTKEPGKGTGLGLSMVFGFMKQSGGHINVYSEPGVGTAFRLYLPRAKEATMTVQPGPAAATRSDRNETILVVEDNAQLRRVVVRQLTELGYAVIEAEDPPHALEALERASHVDLLFTDVVMPGGTTGYELAATVRERWPEIKVVLTSGFPDATIARNGGAASARLLSKPYRRDELGRTVREALQD
jgi:signal transduction histidine kinase